MTRAPSQIEHPIIDTAEPRRTIPAGPATKLTIVANSMPTVARVLPVSGNTLTSPGKHAMQTADVLGCPPCRIVVHPCVFRSNPPPIRLSNRPPHLFMHFNRGQHPVRGVLA
jgi:hypothetical protein